jgi:hypothetical protein
VCCFRLRGFCASRVSPDNDCNIVIIKYLERVGKDSGAAVAAVTVSSVGATNCHINLQ